jgi:hypothetical protein
MAIDFPNSPAPGAQFTTNSKTYTFTGGKWALNVSTGGVTGATGPTGSTGSTGPSGGWFNTQTIVSGATYTPSSADVGKLIQLTNTGSINITLNTGIGLTTGQSIDFLRFGTGAVTIVQGTAVVVATPGLKIRDRYSAATLFCLSTDTYVLMGDLSA